MLFDSTAPADPSPAETPAVPSPPSAAGPDVAAGEGGKPKRTRARKTPQRRPPAGGKSTAAGDKPPAGRGPGKPSNRQKLEDKLGEQLAAIGMVVGVFHEADGVAIARHSEPIAASLARLADENPKVKKYLEGAMTGSAWLGVLIAVGGLAIEVAGNHGAVPALSSVEATGAAGGVVLPFGPAGMPDLSHLSPEEVADLEAMASKIMGGTPPGTDG